MECRSLGTEGRQLRTEAGRKLIGSAGGHLSFWPWDSNLHAKDLSH